MTWPYLPTARVTTATATASASARAVVRRRALKASTIWWAMKASPTATTAKAGCSAASTVSDRITMNVRR